MRVLAWVLILCGSLGLAYEGFASAAGWRREAWWIPPVASGIALVAGLLLLTTAGRRAEG